MGITLLKQRINVVIAFLENNRTFATNIFSAMKHGKATCKILKEIRRDIAAQNNIPLEERECTHEGDCHGTCPYCESKVQYLERELQKRSLMGKAVTIAGIALGSMALNACQPKAQDKIPEVVAQPQTEKVADTIPAPPIDSAQTNKEEEATWEMIVPGEVMCEGIVEDPSDEILTDTIPITDPPQDSL